MYSNRFLAICVLILCRPPAIILLIWMIHSNAANEIVLDSCEIKSGNESMTVSEMQDQCGENKAIGYLMFSNVELRRMPDVFTAFPYLLSIVVPGANLSTITNTTFAKGQNLTNLQLFNNSLTSIDGFVFKRMHVLIELSLQMNRIQTLDEDAFSGLVALKTLELSSNDLRSLGEGVFDPLVKLQSIRLTDNRIEVIDGSTFAQNHDLRSIYLDRNRINTIHTLAFHNLKALRILELSQNFIAVPDFLRVTPNIRQLNICNATVTSIFISSSIRTIRAANNQITRVETESNATAFNIEDLSLANNRLTQVEVFAPLAKMVVLDLSDNNIVSMNFSKLANLTVLRQLILIGNKLAAFNASGIKETLPKLSFIELSINNWPKNISDSIIADFTEQGIYVMNENKSIVNSKVSVLKANNWTYIINPTQPANAPMTDSPASGNSDEIGGKGREEVIRLIQASQQQAEHNKSMQQEIRNLKVVIALFSIAFVAFALVKIAMVVRNRYFHQLIIGNPLRVRSRSNDSFNPIFEDHL